MGQVKSTTYLQLKDWQAAPFSVSQVSLYFILSAEQTVVEKQAVYYRQSAGDLCLNGESLSVQSVLVDGQPWPESRMTQSDAQLILHQVPDAFELTIRVVISPQDNTSLMGLYVSDGNMMTQCEAEGFRRIMYFQDRPDVLSTYQVTIDYDPKQYNTVLSNGEQTEAYSLDDHRMRVVFVDPIPKPCYLFALVAGNLHAIEKIHHSVLGKEIKCLVHLPQSEPLSRAEFAMQSLCEAIDWDERVFRLSYDLPVFHIVATADFNFGAMENKGLNIFNSALVLADAESATDQDHLHVLAVVAHEYFHNWSGNRVTLRDWFQLSLKEGLTVYREQRFAIDMAGEHVRLDYINTMLEQQFPEDSGPLAHPVRPSQIGTIDNFYTATVYHQGAEILRMLDDWLGQSAVTNGICHYLKRYDGQAVTIEDYLAVMGEVNQIDMQQFQRWYNLAGTPLVTVSEATTNDARKVTCQQSAVSRHVQPNYQPLPMPMSCRLIGASGESIVPTVDNDDRIRVNDDGTFHLLLSQLCDEFVLNDVPEDAVLTVFRGLSAPVKVAMVHSLAQKVHIMAHDSDAYTLAEAAKSVMALQMRGQLTAEMLSEVEQVRQKRFRQAESDTQSALALIHIPALKIMMQTQFLGEGVLIETAHSAREEVMGQIAQRHLAMWQQWEEVASTRLSGSYQWNRDDAQLRRLRAKALQMWCVADPVSGVDAALRLYHTTDNITDRMAAIAALVGAKVDASELFDDLYRRSDTNEGLLSRWFYWSAAQAGYQQPLTQLQALWQHKAMRKSRPNLVRHWLAGWMHGGYLAFHEPSGAGYDMLIDAVLEIDQINPQVASGMVNPLTQWRVVDPTRQQKMVGLLEAVATQEISNNLREVVEKTVEAYAHQAR